MSRTKYRNSDFR
ncbi:Protein of unknown function [Pyronema omphalodes CBS 100304]|uniref:Uncharacterized protein n=1 Tax=Pyronema omphalodes (strain CBS 100304) TaxID=1076935 RepID=U4LFK3_PYROM|nr:Protein of unknown function [Pyronema omphalodes CBS 100304]